MWNNIPKTDPSLENAWWENQEDRTSITIANFREILNNVFSAKEINWIRTELIIYNILNWYRLLPKEKQAIDIIIDTAVNEENDFVKELKSKIKSYTSLELSNWKIFFSNEESEDTFVYAQNLKNNWKLDDSLKIFIFLNSNFPNESKYEYWIIDIVIRLKWQELLLFEIFKNNFSSSQIYEKIWDYHDTTPNPNNSIIFYKKALDGADKEDEFLQIIIKIEKNTNPEITDWILSTLLQFFNKNSSSSKIAEKIWDIYNNRWEDKKAVDYYLRAHALLKDNNDIEKIKLAIKLWEVHYCTIVHLIKESKTYEFNNHFLSFLSHSLSYFSLAIGSNLINEEEKEKVRKSFKNVNLLINPETRKRAIDNLRWTSTAKKIIKTLNREIF